MQHQRSHEKMEQQGKQHELKGHYPPKIKVSEISFTKCKSCVALSLISKGVAGCYQGRGTGQD